MLAEREGIHERIQLENQHEYKEAEVAVEESLEVPLTWNEVPDLMMEAQDGRMIMEVAIKLKRDEVACGRRKRQREDDIRPEKREHSLTVSWRTQNPAGLYLEDWDELQQEEYEWQAPHKWQRISQMVFCGGCLEIHPDEAGCISSSCTQHQAGRCSICEAKARLGEKF